MRRSKTFWIALISCISAIAQGTFFVVAEELDVTFLTLYDSLAKAHPEEPEYHYDLGGIYYKNKAWDHAIDPFQQSLKLQPKNLDAEPTTAYALLITNISLEDQKESAQLEEKIPTEDPDYTIAQTDTDGIEKITTKHEITTSCEKQLLEIAQKLAQKNNLLAAIIIYKELLKSDPENVQYFYELGRSYGKLQSWNMAVESYAKAIELDPNNLDAMLGLAYADLFHYLSQDDLYTARNLFMDVLKAVPTYKDAQEGLAKVNKLLDIPQKQEIESGPLPVPIDPPITENTEAPLDDVAENLLLYGYMIKKHDEQPQYYYELGRTYSKIKSWNEAINAFHQALILQPDNEEARLGLAYSHLFRYQSKTKLYESKKLFQDILKINPKYTDASDGLKRVDDLLKGIKFTPQRIPLLQKSEDATSCKTPILSIARELQEQDNGWAAVMFYKELLETDPQNGEYYYELGRSYAKVKSWERAIEAFNRSLELQPDNADARVAVAYSYLFRYLSRCDLSESKILFDEVLRAFPNYSDAEEGLRRVQHTLFDISQPPPPAETPTEESPEKKKLESEQVWKKIALIIAKGLTLQKDCFGALEIYSDLSNSFPDNAEYFFLSGQQLVCLERRCEAITAFKQAIAIKPDYSDALISLGNQYLYFDVIPLSYLMFQRAVNAAPDYVDGLLGLARTEALLNMFYEADSHFLAALSLEPENNDVLTSYAAFLRSQNRYIESEKVYRFLAAINSDNQTYRWNLFDIASHTSPTFYSRIGGGTEREKDQFSNRWLAELSYTNTDAGVIYPIHDKLRVTFKGRWSDLKQRNLIARTTLFDSKATGGGVAAEYFLNPYWTIAAGINMLWIANNNSHATLPTRRGVKLEPSVVFRYTRDKDLIFFGEITDSMVFKNFDKGYVNFFTRETALAGYQHNFGDQLQAGADVAWLWYQDPISNQEQYINLWAQAGLPYFEENLTCRYHSEYRQFKEETTGYYSFEYQWTHWLKFRWYKTWLFGGRCELQYWHGWRTIRGKNPQQQITTSALADLAPVVTVADQINAIYLTLGYNRDENFDISATGGYWNDSFDYTVWGGKISLDWRF